MTDAPAEQQFSEIWETLALEETVDVGQPTQTMRPKEVPRPDVGSFDVSDLPTITDTERLETAPEIELKGVIGKGGMGEVRLARQVPLGRDVAVKSLGQNRETGTQQERMVLLQESWVTGRLEHPNIVPVYTLGRNDSDNPMLVMKSIEGVSWAQLLRDPSSSPRDFDSDNPLDWHLEILSSVCNAVHYAHSKQIVHRDVKPENVMIGAFGEIYLLDWGIAVSLEDEPAGHLPSLADATSPAGTPAYMAPEMAAGEADRLSPQTDVFLLGAVLHEIVTGHPPNSGDTVYQVMFDAYNNEPYDYAAAGVHPELAGICRRAMQQEPEDRYADAEAFRRAIGHHIHHRESIEMTREAEARLGDLEEIVRGGESDARIYEVFGECRFGFEQALKVSEDNELARRGLQRTLELMAEREIEEGAHQAASLLVADLPEPNPELEAKLEELGDQLESREKEYEELQEMRQEHDLEVGRRNRAILALLLGASWSLLVTFIPQIARLVDMAITPRFYLMHAGLVGLLVVAAIKPLKGSLLQNRANRRIAAGLGVIVTSGVLVRVLGAIAGTIDVPMILSMEHLVYASAGTVLAVTMDRRMLVGSLPYFASSFLAALMPSCAYWGAGAACGVSMLLLAWKWWPSHSDDDK